MASSNDLATLRAAQYEAEPEERQAPRLAFDSTDNRQLATNDWPNLTSSIYKPCDIRGDAQTELSEALYESWGFALGLQIPPCEEFAIGGDVRESTPAFLAALQRGLVRAGVRVRNLGTVPTPFVYFAKRRRQTAGCAIVTASHSPPPVNGLKWMVGDLPPSEPDVQALQQAAGTLHTDRVAEPATDLCVTDEYARWLASQTAAKTGPVRRVVIDAGNGCWAGLAGGILRDLYPDTDTHVIHGERDGTFPGRGPDSARPDRLKSLSAAVVTSRADLGVAFDGDGDRVSFVDERGSALSAEETAFILLGSLADRLGGSAFVNDVKFSDRIREAAVTFGANPVSERSGHAFIRRTMIERGAAFGAEISGHYFYGTLDGGDDGLYTACMLVDYLGIVDKPLSALRSDCPGIFMTSDLRVSAPPSDQVELMAEVRQAFGDRPVSEVDGLRIDFDRGWVLVRRSVTEPALTVRAEGASRASLKGIVLTFCDRLERLGPLVRTAYAGERNGNE